MRKKAPLRDIERDNRNTLQAAADEMKAKGIKCSKRTLQRWINEEQTYTERTTKEGREIQRLCVVVNQYQSAKQGRWILRAVYDKNGKKIWSAHRGERQQKPERIARGAELERLARKLLGYKKV